MYSQDELIERFGITDESGEIVVDRDALLRDLIQRNVVLLSQIDGLKEDIKEIVSEADEYGFDKTEFKALVKYSHKNTIDTEIEGLQEVQSKLDNLSGKSAD